MTEAAFGSSAENKFDRLRRLSLTLPAKLDDPDNVDAE